MIDRTKVIIGGSLSHLSHLGLFCPKMLISGGGGGLQMIFRLSS